MQGVQIYLLSRLLAKYSLIIGGGGGEAGGEGMRLGHSIISENSGKNQIKNF